MTHKEAEEAIGHVISTLWRDGRHAEADMLREAIIKKLGEDGLLFLPLLSENPNRTNKVTEEDSLYKWSFDRWILRS